MKSLKTKTIFASTIALLAWFCVILQFYITEGTFSNVLSYFTILSNLLVALSLTFSTFLNGTKLGNFFPILSVKTAIALYIFVVFVVYNIVLRGIWKPTGWQLFLDNMLHVVIPISYILYWIFFVKKQKLRWKHGFFWLIFPLIYLIYSLIRGAIVHWYPYPILDAQKLGYEQVSINIVLMLFVFLASGSALIAINNRFEKH